MPHKAASRRKRGRKWITKWICAPSRASCWPRGELALRRRKAARGIWRRTSFRARDERPAKGAFSRASRSSGCEDILAESERRGFLAVRNSAPEKGVSLSIRLGLEAAKPCSAVLFSSVTSRFSGKEACSGSSKRARRTPKGSSRRKARTGGSAIPACSRQPIFRSLPRSRGPRRKARHPRPSGGGFDRSAAGGRALRHRHKKKIFRA